jgi:Fis family transcriptional regulator, factor for inversion stimulation protein
MSNRQHLERCVQDALAAYLADLHGEVQPSGLHDMMMRTVERPLLADVLKRCGGNQSQAAAWLGLNRNTLRKKLLEHGLLES